MSRGAKRRARCEKHARTLRTHVHVCTCRRVRPHARKCTTTEAKRGHEKHNRTLTPAHTCDRVKIVRAESAPRMRCPRVHACAYKHVPRRCSCLYMHPLGACIRTEGAVYEPRSEAESAPRKRKNKPRHEDVHPKGAHPFKYMRPSGACNRTRRVRFNEPGSGA